MYEIRVNDVIVYACTDENRFLTEAAEYASVRNATLTFKGEPYRG
jgi:hypothetical protein